MKKIFFILFLFTVTFVYGNIDPVFYSTENGTINFKSVAAVEIINAGSQKLSGILNTEKRTFAFRVSIRSFDGFNGALQREHFNENYLESEKFQDASFSGKIIEPVDFSKSGTYHVRAKGILKIHGVEQERIIPGDLSIGDEGIKINAKFIVSLLDHNIRVPRVVHEKIAQEILVEVNATLKRKNP